MKVLVNRSMKRVLALFLAVVALFCVMGANFHFRRVTAEGTEKTYVKVTEVPADWSGEYVIVYEAGNVILDGSLTKLDVASNTQAVTIADGKIEANSAYSFTIAKVEGGYSIRSASGIYMGRTTDANNMNESETTAYTNTINLDAGNVNIIGSGGAYLRYNAASNQTRFRYYKSSSYTNQKPIALYKELKAGECVQHTWNEGEVTTPADCTTDGVKTYTCSVCSETKTEAIEATGHSYGEWEVITPAGCTTAGEQKQTCSVCKDAVTETIEATGHSFQDPEITKEPTCTEAGEQTGTCLSCGETETEEIPATGHSYGEWVETTPASCTAEGEKTKTCSVCEEAVTEVLPKTNHNWNNEDVCTLCGAVATGYVKVTEAPADWSGRYLIVYEDAEKGNFMFNGSLASDKIDTASNALILDTTTNSNKYAFTIAAMDGGYSIQSASGLYIGKTASGNGMNISDEKPYANTIGLDGKNAVITSSYGSTIRFNNAVDQMRFRFYGSGQKPIALYRLEGSPAEEVFVQQQTKADLKFYGDELCIRFGMELDENIYTALAAKGATFHMTLKNGEVEKKLTQDGWVPKAVTNGDKVTYNLWAVFNNVTAGDVNTELTATVVVTIDGKEYSMIAIKTSVAALAASFPTDGLNENQLAAINKAQGN